MSAAPRSSRARGAVSVTLAVLAAGASLSACTEVEPAEKQHYRPASIAPIKGDEERSSVTLTQEGADRIELRTGQVDKRGGHLRIPYAALLYESDGNAFVYTNPSGLTYVPVHIEVDRVAGEHVLLGAGPAVGTKVVTQGAPQVHGAELEYGEY